MADWDHSIYTLELLIEYTPTAPPEGGGRIVKVEREKTVALVPPDDAMAAVESDPIVEPMADYRVARVGAERTVVKVPGRLS